MCIVAMCLGLRVSEVLGLKWTDIDWDGLRIAIRQAYVYGRREDPRLSKVDATGSFAGGEATPTPIQVYFATKQ